ncbi:ABC transporter substrate-binding protein [Nocardia sp. NBC_01329]|uniref:ABC transporter substrate-binding protein n=1 Tax=Nocardia sp. NBC_01329 TaxID=2903594 RepID=UPI002E1105D1
MRRTRTSLGLIFAAVLTLAVSACGSGDSGASRSAGPVTPRAAAGLPVAGCVGGWTDPADRTPDREPARCEANSPQPQPLPGKTKLLVTSSTLQSEFMANVRLAIANGEFEKENLEVELKQVPAADSINLLASGKSDISVGAPDSAFFNGLTAGIDLRWVLGNYFSADDSKAGLWIRDVDGRPGKISDLKGKNIGAIVGSGSVAMYPLTHGFADAGVDIDDVKFQSLPAADLVTSLENGAIPAAWLSDPYWTRISGQNGYTFAIGQPPAEPFGGIIFGPNMLKEKGDAGVAFVRALVRTVNTYLTGDYKADPAMAARVAEAVELPLEIIRQTPSMIFDWEIREGTSDRLQQSFQKTGVFKGSQILPESEVVDRSYYAEAVGQPAS